MTSDNGHSHDEKLKRAAVAIDRLAAGETPEQIKTSPRPEYDPTPAEKEAIAEFLEFPGSLPQYIKVPNLPHMLRFEHPRQEVALAVVMKALGITDQRLYTSMISHVTNALSRGQEAEVAELNAAIALVAGIEPRGHLEAMLAFQMATVHVLSMRHARFMVASETIEQLDLQERVVNKLMRTFTSQMEALRKHRNGGNQKVVVEHVYVGEGGQAIIGNVTHGGRGRNKKGAQSHGQEDLSLPARAALLGHVEEDQVPMPSAGGTREDGLSVPRSPRRSSKGEKERRV
ncbi:hypothetical protein SRABI05_00086 [Agrobacterium fabrum]|uniref:hypothetical protein n=1 Tax=Agrobacterium fabrum TaxID=1176649 RepID=UPI001DBC78E5|nr:hypothetical protein [Agrobacterium fabrum]CAH0132692.1 hypothetical protein SRABI05_00086 [Agrobacterium fabrum]CAH0152147.1 hypothetical protein SRABI46_00801 [Agrobacterium fabrum]